MRFLPGSGLGSVLKKNRIQIRKNAYESETLLKRNPYSVQSIKLWYGTYLPVPGTGTNFLDTGTGTVWYRNGGTG